MVSTRSANKQTHLEDFQGDKSASKSQRKQKSSQSRGKTVPNRSNKSNKDGMLSPPPSPAKKRKSPPASKPEKTEKKAKTEGNADEHDDTNTVIINRAPVLHLWGACVTHFLYPKLAWSTCLSAGSAISTICAVAKGRSIGKIDEPEDTEERRKKKQERKEQEESLDILEVMQFKLNHQDGKVYFSGKPQSTSEDALSGKFSNKYDDVRKVFDEALSSWKGSEDELSKAGFGMYEDFRPNVSKGQKGWGRKGVLDLEIVWKTIEK